MIDETPIAGRAIADLLPWYATGRLSGSDRARVSAALDADPALRRELTLIEEEKHATIAGNAALGGPSRASVDRFFAALETDAAQKSRRFDLAGWLGTRFETLAPRTLAWGAMAAAALFVAQAGLIGALVTGHPTQPPATYDSASVNPAAGLQSGGSLIVAFAPDATAQAIGRLLEDNKASIVAGPLPGGLYEIRVGDHALTKAEMNDLLARFKARSNLIRFAAPGAPPD